MQNMFIDGLSRRSFLAAAGAAAGMAAVPAWAVSSPPGRQFDLTASPGDTHLIDSDGAKTKVWSYNGRVPGPEIRVRQGERLRVAVRNDLTEETTVHWHGLRVPNAMDGVPHLTQKPIAPGETFVYEFDAPDAGTYWYHPHQRSFEQVGRGLYGPLIIEEPNPPQVDRDVTWVLDDWRLLKDAQISEDFGNRHDMSHAGRIGNTVTVNGRITDVFEARAGERIRLRLINAANARIFGLEFEGHAPWVIAYDGQPVDPHQVAGRLDIGPAMRIDLILDLTGNPGDAFAVRDTFYQRLQYRLLDVVYGPKRLREKPMREVAILPANTLPEPDLASAERHQIAFGGGMMGGMSMAKMGGREVGMMEMMRNGKAWTVNGIAATGHIMDPILTLARNRSYILALDNQTAWHHPIHLHGHSFRVISRNGQPTRHKEWQDTVLMAPREQVEIAFVADNPGGWMFHCHILEHQAGGMMGVIQVA
ncbi:MAG: multicopper oxidase family protein [Gammaproteobacteria bacterium]|nr:multicopper oxidase family protein [Alphaproteobacteria bacterium LMO-S08]